MGILEILGKTAFSVKPDSEIHEGYPQVIRTLTTAGHQRCDFLENQNSGNRGVTTGFVHLRLRENK